MKAVIVLLVITLVGVNTGWGKNVTYVNATDVTYEIDVTYATDVTNATNVTGVVGPGLELFVFTSNLSRNEHVQLMIKAENTSNVFIIVNTNVSMHTLQLPDIPFLGQKVTICVEDNLNHDVHDSYGPARTLFTGQGRNNEGQPLHVWDSSTVFLTGRSLIEFVWAGNQWFITNYPKLRESSF